MSVIILLSTYNGGKYLEAQIQSIIQQSYKHFCIYIRDDGSNIETRGLLSKISSQDSRIQSYFGENKGVVGSYFDLISSCKDTFDYFAFCDQDDVWEPDKLERAVSSLEQAGSSIPCMYFSSLNVVDRQLRPLFTTKAPSREISFYNAMVETIATGCTVVFNLAAYKLIINRLPDISKIFMHDWWLYLVVSAFGKLIYDPEPTILYRQHDTNITGLQKGLSKIIRKTMKLSRPVKGPRISVQLAEFLRLYSDILSSENRLVVESFINTTASRCWITRIKSLLGRKFYRQDPFEDLCLIMSVLLGRV